MKLKDYAARIAELAKKYPNVEVVYSSDDEGNSFQKVNFLPDAGRFRGGQWTTEWDLGENGKKKINAVCLN